MFQEKAKEKKISFNTKHELEDSKQRRRQNKSKLLSSISDVLRKTNKQTEKKQI